MSTKRDLIVLLVIIIWTLVSCGPRQSETVSFDATTVESSTALGPTEELQESSTSTVVPTLEPADTPQATATPEPTEEPTNTPEPTITAEPTDPPSLLEKLGLIQGEPDLNVLAERLLSVEDMPAGWSVEATEIEVYEGDDRTYNPYCKTGLLARAIGQVSVDFNGGSLFGPFIFQTISAYPSVEDATTSFAEYKAAANDCQQWTDEEGNEITLSPLSFPAYGDESFAVRFQISGFTADGVQVRVVDVLVGIIQMGQTTDTELQQTIIEKALDKLS